MHEKPPITTVASEAEIPYPSPMMLVVQLRGVLDRQDMPPPTTRLQRAARRRDDLSLRHLGIGEKAAKTEFLRPSSPDAAQYAARPRHQAPKKKAPLFSSRLSPKRPVHAVAVTNIVAAPSK